MPTIKEKIRFNYDGVWSDTLGLMHVVLDSGMFEEAFGASREIVETTVRGSRRPLLHDVTESPLQFDMTIAFKDNFDDSKIDYIIRWLFGKAYKPLYFEGAENKVFMCMPVDSPAIFHTGTKQGYFTVSMRCDSSSVYSHFILTENYHVIDSKALSMYSESYYDIYPEISIKKIGAGNITITNNTNGGSIFEIRDLTDGEDIYIHCKKEIIETDIIGVYRYENIIGDFPLLKYGLNELQVVGNCDIQFRYRFEYKF